MKNDDTWVDPVVEEVHRIRDEHAARIDYVIHRICEDVRREQELDQAGGVEHHAKTASPYCSHKLDTPGQCGAACSA